MGQEQPHRNPAGSSKAIVPMSGGLKGVIPRHYGYPTVDIAATSSATGTANTAIPGKGM